METNREEREMILGAIKKVRDRIIDEGGDPDGQSVYLCTFPALNVFSCCYTEAEIRQIWRTGQ